jgi:hypothetical protein
MDIDQAEETATRTFMTRQEQVGKLDKAMICDCDKYGHAHSAAGEIEPFRIELQCLNATSADRFGHVRRSELLPMPRISSSHSLVPLHCFCHT